MNGSSGATGSNGNPSTILGFESQIFAAAGSGGTGNTGGGSPAGGAGGTVAGSAGSPTPTAGTNGGTGASGLGITSGAGGAGANGGGAGGPAVGGTGGSANGNPGTQPGGGGSGSRTSENNGNRTGGTGAAGRVIITYSTATFSWYDALTGGNLLGSGTNFNPEPHLPNGNNSPAGTYTFYVECSVNPGCRTAVNFTIIPAPTASIDHDGLPGRPTYCSNEIITLYAATTEVPVNSNVTWTTNGAGFFSAPLDINNTPITGPTSHREIIYHPVGADIGNPAGVQITLQTIDPAGECGPAQGSLIIHVNPAATASAGPDQTICSSSIATLPAVPYGGGATGGTWSIAGGDGEVSFDNESNAYIYTPGTADKAQTSQFTVTLTFTTNDPDGPCGTATDFMVLTINPVPVVTITGNPGPVCPSDLNGLSYSGPTGANYVYAWTVTGNYTGNPSLSDNPVIITPGAFANGADFTLQLTITDFGFDTQDGCSATSAPFVVAINSLTASAVKTDITCFGANNGTATATGTGGDISTSSGYTYYWFNILDDQTQDQSRYRRSISG